MKKIMIEIFIAEKKHGEDIKAFFEKHISASNDAIYSEEFLCPYGLKGAISRGQVVIAQDKNKIVGALRFYKRKNGQDISVYQYALDENHRGRGVIKELLLFIGKYRYIVLCPIDSTFNGYYQKTGWILEKQDKGMNQRFINI